MQVSMIKRMAELLNSQKLQQEHGSNVLSIALDSPSREIGEVLNTRWTVTEENSIL